MTTGEEYQRRYTALREAMKAEDYEFLLMVGKGDHGQRGYLRYFSGHGLWDRWGYLLVGVSEDPILILLTVSQRFWAQRLGGVIDVRQHTNPIELVIELLARRAGFKESRIGVAGLGTIMNVSDYLRLREALPDLAIEDASNLVARVQARKSKEELASVEEAGEIADVGYRRFMEDLKPGRSEWELNSVVQQEIFARGVFDTMPLTLQRQGEPYLQVPQDRPYEAGAALSYSIELPSPGGYWVELARMFSLGRPSPDVADQVACLHEAHRSAASLLEPGVRAGDVAAAAERVAAEGGYRTGIWLGHGIGLDLPDWPPLIVGEETPIEEGMVVAMHPHVIDQNEQRGVYVGDTYIVTAAGARSLSEIPLEFFQID